MSVEGTCASENAAGVLFVCYAAARFPVIGMCGSSVVEGCEEMLEPCQESVR